MSLSKPLNTVIVLNSLSLLSQAKERLNKAQAVHCFLDRDKQGTATVEKLKEYGLTVLDRSVIYDGFKDFSDFIKLKQAEIRLNKGSFIHESSLNFQNNS